MMHQEERQRNGMNLGLRRFGPGKHHKWHPRSHDDAAGLAPGKIRNGPIQDIGRLDVGSNEHIRSLYNWARNGFAVSGKAAEGNIQGQGAFQVST